MERCFLFGNGIDAGRNKVNIINIRKQKQNINGCVKGRIQ
jgi:hypothetical protein